MQHLGLKRLSPQRLAIAPLLLLLAISILSLSGKASEDIYQLDRGDVLDNMHFADKLYDDDVGIPGFLSDDRAGVESIADGSGPSNDLHMNAIAQPRYTPEDFLEQWYGDRRDQAETSNT